MSPTKINRSWKGRQHIIFIESCQKEYDKIRNSYWTAGVSTPLVVGRTLPRTHTWVTFYKDDLSPFLFKHLLVSGPWCLLSYCPNTYSTCISFPSTSMYPVTSTYLYSIPATNLYLVPCTYLCSVPMPTCIFVSSTN
jgi:hypothetical protein